MAELAKEYRAQDYELSIYQRWEKEGFFNPDTCPNRSGKPYAIVMPPPNVTGTLHLGHAVMLTLEDILIRYHRMRGDKTLWLPGTDHAAIATQTKVEKILKAEGLTRHELGREKFLERVRQFAQQSHDTIVNQVRRMGSSCDWSREAYTLDEIRTRAVRTVFKMMYDDGLIYRGERVVNWCPRCHSTLADDEVEYKEQKAKLYTFKYAPDFPLTIATTRPETKLGDTAVAVNPKDERYRQFVGKEYEVDFCGIRLNLKVIADRAIEMDFGTGALGVTPAHSHIDWQLAQDNHLRAIKVINEDGRIRDGFGRFSGLTVQEARQQIVEELKKRNLLVKEEEIDNKLSVCYRCGAPIEPLPSLQWFINVNKPIQRLGGKTIKDVCLEVVRDGLEGDTRKKITIYPERFTKHYFHWINDLRDWCISRQIWFGHQIPVWYRKKPKPPQTVEVCFMRHGQTDWNAKSIMQGTVDTELNEIGLKQAQAKAKTVDEFQPDVIIVSPLKRALQTAQIAAQGKYQIITDERIKERYYAEAQGMSFGQIKERYPNFDSFVVNGLPYLVEVPEGGETYEQAYERMEEFLVDLVKNYGGKRVLVVSHGDPLDMAEAILAGKHWREGVGSWHNNMRVKKAEIYLTSEEKPRFYEPEEVYVGIDPPSGEGWRQDPDTLDTWFSSGLWTFSTLARSPQDFKIQDGRLVVDSQDFKDFHPTAVLETGYDILFFWVARMIIMTTYAIGDIPFYDVYLHGLVLDSEGKKMSKSKGNVIDPLEMADKYGTDAVRLTLVIGSSPGNDLRLSEEKIAGFRNLANKLWNISRFILTKFPSSCQTDQEVELSQLELTLADRWILSKFFRLIKEITQDLDNYRFSAAGEKLREFSWGDLADWYLEASKFEDTASKPPLLGYILKNLLALWHPFIPFVTEAIWSHLNQKQMLIISSWPKPVEIDWRGEEFELIKEMIISIRNARAENGVEPGRRVGAVIFAPVNLDLEVIKSNAHLIQGLRTGIESLQIRERGEKPKNAILATVGGVEIYLLGAIDPQKEKTRLEKEIQKLEQLIKASQTRLNNSNFIQKAPSAVVEREKANLAQRQAEMQTLRDKYASLN